MPTPPEPPGPRGSLLLGMARDLQRDQLGTLERAMTTYGDVVRLSAGPPGRRVRAHLLTHPDRVQRVLAGGAANYVKGTRFYRVTAAAVSWPRRSPGGTARAAPAPGSRPGGPARARR